MILRRISGKDTREALRKVEQELGPGAILVETRRVGNRTVVLAQRPEPEQASPAKGLELPEARTKRPELRRYRKAFRPWAERLLGFGLPDRLVAVLDRTFEGLDPTVLHEDNPALPSILRRVLAALISCSGEPIDERITVLVGPTGVGKTTTLAKLLSRACLEKHQRCAVLTLDRFRVGATEQLRTWCDMLEVPMRIVFEPADLDRALLEFGDRDRILVDTTGRGPRDREALSDMASCLRRLPARTHLCIPAATRRSDLELVRQGFEPFRPDAWLLTKWDESSLPGEALGGILESNRPLSWITDGQEVPDDLLLAEATALAGVALGIDA